MMGGPSPAAPGSGGGGGGRSATFRGDDPGLSRPGHHGEGARAKPERKAANGHYVIVPDPAAGEYLAARIAVPCRCWMATAGLAGKIREISPKGQEVDRRLLVHGSCTEAGDHFLRSHRARYRQDLSFPALSPAAQRHQVLIPTSLTPIIPQLLGAGFLISGHYADAAGTRGGPATLAPDVRTSAGKRRWRSRRPAVPGAGPSRRSMVIRVDMDVERAQIAENAMQYVKPHPVPSATSSRVCGRRWPAP